MSLRMSKTDRFLETYREYMDETWELLSPERKKFWDKVFKEIEEAEE